jgi:hypothetical protein
VAGLALGAGQASGDRGGGEACARGGSSHGVAELAARADRVRAWGGAGRGVASEGANERALALARGRLRGRMALARAAARRLAFLMFGATGLRAWGWRAVQRQSLREAEGTDGRALAPAGGRAWGGGRLPWPCSSDRRGEGRWGEMKGRKRWDAGQGVSPGGATVDCGMSSAWPSCEAPSELPNPA